MRRGAIVLGLLAMLARAEEHKAFNFAIAWPAGEGWNAPEDGEGPAGARLHRGVVDNTRGRTFLLYVMDPRGTTLDDEVYAREVVRGISKSLPGARLVSQHRHEIEGVPALTIRAVAKRGEGTIGMLIQAVIANDNLYMLSASWLDDDEGWVPAAIASFRFLSTPPEASTAYRVGYGFGRHVLGPALLVGALLGIVLLVRKLARRRAD